MSPPNPSEAASSTFRQHPLDITTPQAFERLRSLVGGAEPEVTCDLQDELRLGVLAQPIDEMLDARCISL